MHCIMMCKTMSCMVLFSQSLVVHGIVSHDDAFLRHLVSHASRKKKRERLNPMALIVLWVVYCTRVVISHVRKDLPGCSGSDDTCASPRPYTQNPKTTKL